GEARRDGGSLSRQRAGRRRGEGRHCRCRQPSRFQGPKRNAEEHFQAYFEREPSSTLGGVLQILQESRQLQCSSLNNFSDPTFMKDYMEAFTLTASVTFLTGIIQNLFHCILALPKANATSILLFLLSVATLQLSTSIVITYKHIPIAFPMELLLIIRVTIISNRIHLHAESSSAVISMIPQRFLPPTPPDLSNLSKLILHAFSLAIVSYFLLVFVGEKYASLHNYNIASNQELIAVGLCNICSSFFKSFVVSCAISETIIREKTGGRTQVIWLVTFAAVVCFGLDVGLVIAMGFTFFIITVRSHRRKMMVLGQIPNMNIYRSLSVYRAVREIEGIKIFQCCSSISFANMNHFKTYLLHKTDMKAVPLDESEGRAGVERKDLKCSCVCHPVLPPPRISFKSGSSKSESGITGHFKVWKSKIPCREKLVKRCHADSNSSSVNLVHWSKYGDKLSSRTLLMGAANAQCTSPGCNRTLRTEKNEDERRRGGRSPGSATDNSSVQLHQAEQPRHLPCPVHTIILDFSMVQFVDLIGSELLQQIIHMFHNIGLTVLIAGCHFSVIADFEKSDFFDSCITKERFFLTLHDAVLAALDKHQKPDELGPTAKEFAQEALAEQQKEQSLLLKNKAFFFAKNSDNKLLLEEPVSDISCSAQNKAEPSSLQQYDTPPLQSDFQDPGWGKTWKYTRNP
ncbi:testis anion transporter 1, partial [Falco peregrinus]|uniref:testis anion transporter 1 n=1 Tax=Falco peregrinus TaxID=8954 RepID=UPI00247A41B2